MKALWGDIVRYFPSFPDVDVDSLDDLNGSTGPSIWAPHLTSGPIALPVALLSGAAMSNDEMTPAATLISGRDDNDAITKPIALFTGRIDNDGVYTGTPGDDVLNGTSGNDTFDISSGGNDTVYANGGDDTVLAGASLTSSDHIVGAGMVSTPDGGGNLNQLIVVLDGDYSAGLTLSPTTLVNVTNLQLNAGHSYKLTVDNAIIGSLPSESRTLWVDGSNLKAADNLYYDGRSIVDGTQQISFYGGDCTLYGGGGSDVISNYGRSGTIYGGAGNDLLVSSQTGTGVVYAGAGLNTIELEPKAGSSTTVYGGPQDDDVWIHSIGGTAQTVVANGDTGDDYYYLSGDGLVTANAGDGSDVFYLDQSGSGATVTLGSGADILIPISGRTPFVTTADAQTTYVTDFTAGSGGDVVYLYYALRQAQPAWGAGIDPFAAGYLQILQSGTDAIIQIKSGDAWHSLLVLEHTAASAVIPGINVRYDTTPTTTVQVTADYTISADQIVTTYGSQDRDQFGSTAIPAAVAVGYPDTPVIKPVVSNYGTIVLSSIDMSLSSTFPVGGGAAIEGGPWGATLKNYGTIQTYTRGAPHTSLDAAYGLYSLYSWTVDNAAGGQIELSATSAWGISCGGGRVTNDGLIDIHGSAAFGIYSNNGYFYSIANTGTISVSALGGTAHAIDASEPQSYLELLTNTGTITATEVAALSPSVGIYIRTGTTQIDNSGLISAEHAIEVVGSGTYNDGPHSVIVNNTGHIVGDLLLGIGDDHYNGANGSLQGMIDAGAGNDVVTCGADADVVDGGEGDDSISGGGGNDVLTGGAGNDVLDGGDGYDKAVFSGNSGSYTITANADGSTTVAGPDGTDTLRNIEEADFADKQILIGTITGTSGNDTLTGTANNDVFDLSQGGNDTASGLGGNDTFNMGAALNALDRIDGGSGTDSVTLSGDYTATPLVFGATTLLNVENITLAGGHSYSLTTNDATVAAGQTLTVDVSQLGAANALTFDGRAETDGSFVVTGGAGNDALYSGAGNDVLTGGAGQDTFRPGSGNDTASGGDGNDGFVVGGNLTAADKLDGGAGNDTVWLNGDYSGAHALVMNATTMVNIERMVLQAGHNFAITTADATVAAGQTLTVDASTLGGSLTFDGRAETDGSFVVTGGVGNDALYGGAGNDVLTGGAGQDTFRPGSGNDRLNGGDGDDSFVVGGDLTAADKLDGGAGNDTVWLNGDYSGAQALVMNATTMVNIEKMVLQAGHSFAITTADATVAAGQTLTVDASSLGGTLTFDGRAETDGNFVVTGGAGYDTLNGGAGNDVLTGGAGQDTFRPGSGNDTLNGGDGNDSFVVGSDLTAADKLDGGAGTDTVWLNGDYSGTHALVMNAATMVNVEKLVLQAGHSFAITTADATVAAGEKLTVDASTLGGSLTFDGRAETDGSFVVTGGAGSDALYGGAGNDILSGGAGVDTFRPGSGNDRVNGGDGDDSFVVGGDLTSADRLDGGAGTDTVWLNGDYSGAHALVLNAATMVNIEKIVLQSGNNYAITTADATVAAGQTLTIDASGLSAAKAMIFNGSAETDGHFIIIGGLGADDITAGAQSDTFVYTAANQSSSTTYDTLRGVNFDLDHFDLPGTVTAIDAALASGTLDSGAKFDTELHNALTGHLGSHHAMLFTASAGTLAGQTFLVVDVNGIAGYDAGSDLAIHLVGQTGTLAVGGFT